MDGSAVLLVLSVAVVGVLHTVVPDHWVPITLMARQRGWSKGETAKAALTAGTGHVLTTLIIGLVVWAAGVAFATRFGHWVDTIASLALIGFGGWIAASAWRELRGGKGHGHSHGLFSGHDHGPHDHQIRSGSIHGPELQSINTGHGGAELSIFEDGIPPHFRFTGPAVDWVRAETVREDGNCQFFAFANRGEYWESIDEIPEPHGFEVIVTLGHGAHDPPTRFTLPSTSMGRTATITTISTTTRRTIRSMRPCEALPSLLVTRTCIGMVGSPTPTDTITAPTRCMKSLRRTRPRRLCINTNTRPARGWLCC